MGKYTESPWLPTWRKHKANGSYDLVEVAEPTGECTPAIQAHGGSFRVAIIMGGDQLTRIANAKLVAAAPELLEALQDILGSCNVRIDDPRCELFDAARAAIVKATT